MSEKIKLGELGEIVSGSTPKTNVKEYWNGEILWITPAEIQEDDYYIADTQRKITNLAVEKTNLKLLPKGTVLLSSRAPIGKVAICDNNMYCNQGFKNIICSDRLENRYVYYFLKHNVEYIKSLGRGATFKEISKGIVENLEIPYRGKKEQIEIANELDKITEILKIRKQQIKKFDEIIKSQFVEMFGNPFLNDKNWKTNTIGNCCALKSGNSLPTKVENEGGDILYIKVGDMNLKGNEKYITTSSHKVTEKTAGKGIFESGTVLFPKRGGAIGTNKKRLTKSKICADLNIMGVTPIKEINSSLLLEETTSFCLPFFLDLEIRKHKIPIAKIKTKDKTLLKIIICVSDKRLIIYKCLMCFFNIVVSQIF